MPRARIVAGERELDAPHSGAYRHALWRRRVLEYFVPARKPGETEDILTIPRLLSKHNFLAKKLYNSVFVRRPPSPVCDASGIGPSRCFVKENQLHLPPGTGCYRASTCEIIHLAMLYIPSPSSTKIQAGFSGLIEC